MIELTSKDWEQAIKEMEMVEKNALINLSTSRSFIENAKKQIEILKKSEEKENKVTGVG